MSAQLYIVNKTLLTYRLIDLEKYEFVSYLDRPKEWRQNGAIEVRLRDGEGERRFPGCAIDPQYRLGLPVEAAAWIKNHFPFSEAYFLANPERDSLSNKQGVESLRKLEKKGERLRVPVEALLLSWETGEGTPYLLAAPAFRITAENAAQCLTPEALASVLPYILSGVRNTSCAPPREKGEKCYIIDRTTGWLPAREYRGTPFSHPGIYLLRRKAGDGYAYYVGKAADVKARVTADGEAVFHPLEKGEEEKRYDDAACISVNFDSLRELFGSLDPADVTPPNNPGVTRGSPTDRALYAVEDVIIHALAMVLKSEGMRLDNRQYRSYTTEQLDKT